MRLCSTKYHSTVNPLLSEEIHSIDTSHCITKSECKLYCCCSSMSYHSSYITAKCSSFLTITYPSIRSPRLQSAKKIITATVLESFISKFPITSALSTLPLTSVQHEIFQKWTEWTEWTEVIQSLHGRLLIQQRRVVEKTFNEVLLYSSLTLIDLRRRRIYLPPSEFTDESAMCVHFENSTEWIFLSCS